MSEPVRCVNCHVPLDRDWDAHDLWDTGDSEPVDRWYCPDCCPRPECNEDASVTARYIIGDSAKVTATLPDDSVDLVLTSPPFLALRSYLPADHPDKDSEIGSEATPAEFLDVLLALTAEWERVLTPHGSICVELGDTYAGGNGFDIPDPKSPHRDEHSGLIRGRKPAGGAWPLAKSLTGIPHLYHLSLTYGRNLLTGEPSPAGQWRVRNVVAWVRPNPPVGALGDKFRPATSYLTVATKSRTRWFDLDAVRTEYSDRFKKGVDGGERRGAMPGAGAEVAMAQFPKEMKSDHAGAPPLDWWNVSTEPYKGSHYATWPRALCVTPIRAMCPGQVCNVCGEPRRRIVGEAEYVQTRNGGTPAVMDFREGESTGVGVRSPKTTGGDSSVTRTAPTLGWTDCGHGDYRRGVVFDPFAGSGTTLAVAEGNGRDSIGIDIDRRNLDLAYERCGMFLEVETGDPA